MMFRTMVCSGCAAVDFAAEETPRSGTGLLCEGSGRLLRGRDCLNLVAVRRRPEEVVLISLIVIL